MAGTIVSQEVIGCAATKELMRAMGWNHSEAIGRLVLLWNESQNRGVSRASARQIVIWCQAEGEEEGRRLIEAMCSEGVGYLKRVRLDVYEIVGNRKHVRKLKDLKALRRRQGQSTKSKFAKRKLESVPAQDAEPTQDAMPCPALPFPAPLRPSISAPLCSATSPSASVPAGNGNGSSDDDVAVAQAKLEVARLARGVGSNGLRGVV